MEEASQAFDQEQCYEGMFVKPSILLQMTVLVHNDYEDMFAKQD